MTMMTIHSYKEGVMIDLGTLKDGKWFMKELATFYNLKRGDNNE